LTARIGGEEFVVVMPDTTGAAAMAVAERLCVTIAENQVQTATLKQSLSVTASIGIATLLGPAESASNLLSRADEAMYRAKAAGRNRVIANESMPTERDVSGFARPGAPSPLS
jgi:two-component system, cell cycle response regulator